MKKTVRRLLAAMLAGMMLMFTAAMPTAADTIKYVERDMNFRVGPGTNYKVIGSVPGGAKVSLLAAYNDWTRIRYNGQTGWIHSGNFADTIIVQSTTGTTTTPTTPAVTFPTASTPGETWTVKVDSGYLALRTAQAFETANEIGKLYTGQTVRVTQKPSGSYWIVYAPTLGKGGYVNKNFLVKNTTNNTTTTVKEIKTVKVSDGYLALRTAKEFKYENEIGKLYTGDKVEVISEDEGTYWYVYSSKLGKKGYVNKNYLVD